MKNNLKAQLEKYTKIPELSLANFDLKQAKVKSNYSYSEVSQKMSEISQTRQNYFRKSNEKMKIEFNDTKIIQETEEKHLGTKINDKQKETQYPIDYETVINTVPNFKFPIQKQLPSTYEIQQSPRRFAQITNNYENKNDSKFPDKGYQDICYTDYSITYNNPKQVINHDYHYNDDYLKDNRNNAKKKPYKIPEIIERSFTSPVKSSLTVATNEWKRQFP